MWFLTVSEIAQEQPDGSLIGTGRYRQTARSDQGGGIHGLCKHEHATREEARACSDANASHHYYGLNTPRPRR